MDNVNASQPHTKPTTSDNTTGVALRCPCCFVEIDTLCCSRCGFQMQVESGVVHALLPERVEHYAAFVKDYEAIRCAEGRYSETDDYYLHLPHFDKSGRNQQQWAIRAKSFDYLMQHVLSPACVNLKILDIGAGNCWMSYRLILAGHRAVAVDLLTNRQDGLAAGERYDHHLEQPIPRFQAEMTRLPFRAEQFDAVVFNASFHYAESYESALREALRCLKPGGQVVVSDTPWYPRESSGQEMIAERQASFICRYGTASDSIASLEYLTDERLRALEGALSLRWIRHTPNYGLRWRLRPLIAKLRRRREPSRFRIYVAKKNV